MHPHSCNREHHRKRMDSSRERAASPMLPASHTIHVTRIPEPRTPHFSSLPAAHSANPGRRLVCVVMPPDCLRARSQAGSRRQFEQVPRGLVAGMNGELADPDDAIGPVRCESGTCPVRVIIASASLVRSFVLDYELVRRTLQISTPG